MGNRISGRYPKNEKGWNKGAKIMSTMREEIYSKLHPILEELVDTTCDHIGRLEVDEENISADDVIEMLDRLKSTHPKQVIVVETPNGSVDFRIGDALIYEGIGGEIVIDSE